MQRPQILPDADICGRCFISAGFRAVCVLCYAAAYCGAVALLLLLC